MLYFYGQCQEGTRSFQYSAKYWSWGQIHGIPGIPFFFYPRDVEFHVTQGGIADLSGPQLPQPSID